MQFVGLMLGTRAGLDDSATKIFAKDPAVFTRGHQPRLTDQT